MKKILILTSLTIFSIGSISSLWGQGPNNNPITLIANAPPAVNTPSVQIVGNQGSATYVYWVVANYPVGSASPSGGGIVINAPSTLTGSNYVKVSWNTIPGVLSYDLLRTTSLANIPSGNCNCAVATGLASTATPYSNTSNSLSSYTVNSVGSVKANITLLNRNHTTPRIDIDTPLNLPYIGYFGIGTTLNPLPVASKAYRIAIVNNGSTASDCTVGGGTSFVLCMDTGSVWTAIGGSGTGGGPYVPYTGAISDVNLGSHNLSTTGIVYGWPAVYIQPSGICGLGDSYISGKTGSSNTIWDSTWWNQLILKTGLLLVNNGGVQGQTTAQILARVSTDVLAWPCGTVIYDGGTNDVRGSVPFATTKANIIATMAQIESSSRRVVIATIAPQIGFNAEVTQINTWLHAYAVANGIAIVDIYAIVTDPTTGNFKSGYTFDNIHPSPMACRLIADSALSAIQAMLPGWSPMAPQSNVDTNNLLPNGMMLNISTDIPTGWTKQTPSGNVTWSVAPATGINGNALIMTKTATGSSADNDRTFYAITSGFSVGDRIAFSGKFIATGFEASSGGIAIDMFMYNSGFATQLDMGPVKSWIAADEPTVVQWYMEGIVPTTVTQFVLTVGIFSTGTGVLKVGQIGVYNLTTLNAL